MLFLGIDLGTSSVKVSVLDGDSRLVLASTQYPDAERDIISLREGWAEQAPDTWWDDVKCAIKKVVATGGFDSHAIGAIGIAYQMHGLVMLDRKGDVLRNSIIWCDSRAVTLGETALKQMGEDYCLKSLLNSPGNFTAAKLAWVKMYEPWLFERIDKIMWPGDFISRRFTGQTTVTTSSLSEGMFWNFINHSVDEKILDHFGFERNLLPEIEPVFGSHGRLEATVARELSLQPGIPVTYKAGDQLNNAVSLNVFEPGEVAAVAGTSGVIFGVSDRLISDRQSRVNGFAHVNHAPDMTRVGMLLCINGAGILNRWVKNLMGNISYPAMNSLAASVQPGSGGLHLLPFGNGAERMFGNKIMNMSLKNVDFNRHSGAHIIRAAQEGIAFAFRYGLDILRENNISPGIIRAAKANLFLSDVFLEAFSNSTNLPVELYNGDGSFGSAIGAAIGAGYYSSPSEAFVGIQSLSVTHPAKTEVYEGAYQKWLEHLHDTVLHEYVF